jgi:hypothetical protein
MSDVVLRGLLISNIASISPVSKPSDVKLKGLSINEPEEQPAISNLKIADKLALSDTVQGNSKGSVPLSLVSPDEMLTKTPNSANTRKKSSSNILQGLSLNSNVKQTPQREKAPPTKTLYSLADLEIKSKTTYSVQSTTTYTQTNGNKKISGTQSISISGSVTAVQTTDKISSKLSNAIDKIKNWDRKITVLNTELNKQKSGVTNDPSKLIDKTEAVAKARTDALASRKEAIEAYNEAVKEIKAQFASTGITASSAKEYRDNYNTMESLFANTDSKDKTVMQSVMGYMKEVMTPENFQSALSYLNPFSSTY